MMKCRNCGNNEEKHPWYLCEDFETDDDPFIENGKVRE